MNTDWIKNFNKEEFIGPFVIDKDCDYEAAMISKITAFLKILKPNLDKDTYSSLQYFSENVMHTVHLVYEGRADEAQAFIQECFEDFENGEISFVTANSCPAFYGYKPDKEYEIQFFRARMGEDFCAYNKQDMFHVPFNMRGKVETTRFSIPGLPCLYLSNTSYGCWVELGKPQDDKLSVSPVVVDNEVKVLNLAVSIFDIFEFVDLKICDSDDDWNKKFCEYSKLMVLMIASSFVVLEKDRKFKSEYIISQMVMLAIKDNGYDGVVYYSKKTASDLYSRVSVNLALYATFDPGKDVLYSSCLSKRVFIGNSYNFALYQHLNGVNLMNSYRLAIDGMNGRVIIGDSGKYYLYRNTLFHDFDAHIFSGWKNREHPL